MQGPLSEVSRAKKCLPVAFAVLLMCGIVLHNMDSYTSDLNSHLTKGPIHSDSDLNDREHNEDLDNPSTDNLNVLLIMTDQQRYDMIGALQKRLPHYRGKTKVKTPNLEKLMEESTVFMRHHTQCAVCGPARSSLYTGCTIERTGVQSNSLTERRHYALTQFEEKIKEMHSFDQILSEERNYNCEHYGKWHLPERLYYKTGSAIHKAVQYNTFDYAKNVPVFDEKSVVLRQRKECLKPLEDKLRQVINGTEQIDPNSGYPYAPTALDSRYGYPGGTSLQENKELCFTQNCLKGRDTLGKEHSSTKCTATLAMSALDRLVSNSEPWCLTASFHSPHPPMIAPGEYFDRYWEPREEFFIPPSIDVTHMNNSAYNPDPNTMIQNVDALKEWMVSYYALVEEIDDHVGRLLNKLAGLNQTKNTLVIFTSDHGESLGAHGRGEKNSFYEESIRVPLMIRLPGKVPQRKEINVPTSHIDLFSTLLDYTGSEVYDDSDGKSLRRFIDDTNFNAEYDNEVVVSEWDYRTPIRKGSSYILDRNLGTSSPSFMVVKGNWKLMITKEASSPQRDHLHNTALDPFEMNNLLGENGPLALEEVIGKAEHLKALLLEWMKRMDGSKGLYSDPVHNSGEGKGDIAEIRARRTWRHLPIWVSDTELSVGKPARVDSSYVRNEFLYIGRTTPGNLEIYGISVEGKDSHLVTLTGNDVRMIKTNTYAKVKVTLQSSQNDFTVLDAQIRVSHSEGKDILVKLNRGSASHV